MATVKEWNPFGVSLNITAVSASVTRTSATQYKVKINASWESYWGSAKTNYGMTASSGGGSANLNTFGNKASSGSGSFTGTYSISGNGSATKTITVTFKNYNSDNGNSATKSVSFNVTVPAWTSYPVKYYANGRGTAPSAQTKWKDQALTLAAAISATGYTFQKWNTKSDGSGTSYNAKASYTGNAALNLYAIWKANTFTIKFDANGGTGAPANKTKTYGVDLTLPTDIPTLKNYRFLGWSTSKTAIAPTYLAGGKYTPNAGATLYAVWELAYVKPKITDVKANRCNEQGMLLDDGGLLDDGEYARIDFTWSCFQDVTSIIINWHSIGTGTRSDTISATGTNGTESIVIGPLAVDEPYEIQIRVTDIETTVFYTHVAGRKYVMDGMIGGVGVSFGKKADTPELADFAWPIYPEEGFKYPKLGMYTDLNNIMTPNTYFGDAASTYQYTNCPITSATSFTLEVFPAGSSGQIMQRLTSCSASPAIYHRHYYSDTWHDWVKTY